MRKFLAILIIRDTNHFSLWSRALKIGLDESDGIHFTITQRLQLWAIGTLMGII